MELQAPATDQGLRDLENRIIGSILMKESLFENVCDLISAADFSTPLLARTWEVFHRLRAEQQPIDLVLVTEKIESGGNAYAGFMGDLAELARNSHSPVNAVYYARILASHSFAKRAQRVVERYQATLSDYRLLRQAPVDIVGDLVSELDTLSGPWVAAEPLDTPEAAMKIAEQFSDMLNGTDGVADFRVDLGLPRLNAYTGGGRRQDLTVLAGRPSHGKTAYALRVLAKNSILCKSPARAVFFTLEMSQEKLIKRLIAMITGLPFEVVDRPSPESLAKHNLSSEYAKKLILGAAKRIAEAPLHIAECSTPDSQRASGMARTAKRWAAHFGGLDLVVTDYLQLMRGERGSENATDESVISSNSRAMKGMAKMFDCHVMLLSQLNRQLEMRDICQRRRRLSDLRGSGSIEQDADIITFVYQDHLYNPQSPAKGQVELIVGKNRDGALVTTRARLEMECSRMHAYSAETEQAIEEHLRQASLPPAARRKARK